MHYRNNVTFTQAMPVIDLLHMAQFRLTYRMNCLSSCHWQGGVINHLLADNDG